MNNTHVLVTYITNEQYTCTSDIYNQLQYHDVKMCQGFLYI